MLASRATTGLGANARFKAVNELGRQPWEGVFDWDFPELGVKGSKAVSPAFGQKCSGVGLSSKFWFLLGRRKDITPRGLLDGRKREVTDGNLRSSGYCVEFGRELLKPLSAPFFLWKLFRPKLQLTLCPASSFLFSLLYASLKTNWLDKILTKVILGDKWFLIDLTMHICFEKFESYRREFGQSFSRVFSP
jgi:hypothetical protein